MLKNVKKEEKITPQQQKFINEYAKNLDLTRALDAAGYSGNGARAQAIKMLEREKFQRALYSRIEESAKFLSIGKGYILKKYFEILNYSMRNMDLKGEFDPVLALRALDGMCKNSFGKKSDEGEKPFENRVLGLDIGKI